MYTRPYSRACSRTISDTNIETLVRARPFLQSDDLAWSFPINADEEKAIVMYLLGIVNASQSNCFIRAASEGDGHYRRRQGRF
jgi:hypothetical protein